MKSLQRLRIWSSFIEKLKLFNQTKGIKKQKKEIIAFHKKKIAEKEEVAKCKQAKKEEIANRELVLDEKKIAKLTGKLLKEQLAAFKTAGAPNLDNVSTQAWVGELKVALTAAITIYEDQKWNLFKESQKEGDEMEIFDFDTVLDEEGEDWKDVEEMWYKSDWLLYYYRPCFDL